MINLNEIVIKRYAASLVRHVLTLGAGYLASQGLLTGDNTDLIAALATTVVSVGWSFYIKRWKARGVGVR